jgi:hypothetical protein
MHVLTIFCIEIQWVQQARDDSGNKKRYKTLLRPNSRPQRRGEDTELFDEQQHFYPVKTTMTYAKVELKNLKSVKIPQDSM